MKLIEKIKSIKDYLIKIKSIKKAITDFNIKEKYKNLRELLKQKYSLYREKAFATWELMQRDKREKTRITILGISALFVFDYIMFSYHIDKNIFDIFPSIPVIENKDKINIYLPSEGCREIISEKREINKSIDDDILVIKLVSLVAEGSYFENTASNVPVKLLVKKVWMTEDENGGGNVCLIDLSPVILEKEVAIVQGSEQMFKDALEKTIKENVPGVTRVILLEKGVPGRKIWEI